MTEKEKEIYALIENGKTLNEIAKNVRLSSKQVHQKIQKLINDGYAISPIYFDDGNISYVLEKNESKHTINLSLSDSTKFKALVVSDIHIGNVKENLNYLYRSYDYARDHNINIILNCGDLIDGTFTKGRQMIGNIDKQIERAIALYPYDKNILNIMCYGNHDYSSCENGRDMAKAIYQRRYDLINGGYGICLVNLERDQIVLSHPLYNNSYKTVPNKFILEGHHHKMMMKINRNNFIVNVPALSDLCFGEQNNPGMLEINLVLNGGFIQKGHLKHISVKDKLEIYGESDLEFFFKHENVNEKKLVMK